MGDYNQQNNQNKGNPNQKSGNPQNKDAGGSCGTGAKDESCSSGAKPYGNKAANQ